MRAHRHLGGAMRSPHPPKRDRVSRNWEQSEPWLDDVIESVPACSQARVRDGTNAECPIRRIEIVVTIEGMIIVGVETKRWKLALF